MIWVELARLAAARVSSADNNVGIQLWLQCWRRLLPLLQPHTASGTSDTNLPPVCWLTEHLKVLTALAGIPADSQHSNLHQVTAAVQNWLPIAPKEELRHRSVMGQLAICWRLACGKGGQPVQQFVFDIWQNVIRRELDLDADQVATWYYEAIKATLERDDAERAEQLCRSANARDLASVLQMTGSAILVNSARCGALAAVQVYHRYLAFTVEHVCASQLLVLRAGLQYAHADYCFWLVETFKLDYEHWTVLHGFAAFSTWMK